MRHGKAEDSFEKTDFERNLVEKGVKKSKKTIQYLLKNNIKPAFVLVSAAQRTIQTAEVAIEILGLKKEVIKIEQSLYLASDNEILNTIYATDNSAESLMIIGHNPGMSNIATYLSNRNIDWMPTSAIVGIEFKMQDWNEIANAPAKLLFYTKSSDL